MSRVRKCDICGAVYDEYPVGESMLISKRTRETSTSIIGENTLDVCEKCSKKIDEFIDVLKSGYRYCIYMSEDEFVV